MPKFREDLTATIPAAYTVLMSLRAAIQSKLESALAPTRLNVTDDSRHHAGHAGAREGAETHFTVEIVSAHFAGQSRVARQRMVYALLADEFALGVHALALRTLTPDEARLNP